MVSFLVTTAAWDCHLALTYGRITFPVFLSLGIFRFSRVIRVGFCIFLSARFAAIYLWSISGAYSIMGMLGEWSIVTVSVFLFLALRPVIMGLPLWNLSFSILVTCYRRSVFLMFLTSLRCEASVLKHVNFMRAVLRSVLRYVGQVAVIYC